jgi:hypothetical protein
MRDYGLNLDDDDLSLIRFYLTSYCLIQFACCLILFLLNNWHYFLKWHDVLLSNTNRTDKLRYTLSVTEFLNKYKDKKTNLEI